MSLNFVKIDELVSVKTKLVADEMNKKKKLAWHFFTSEFLIYYSLFYENLHSLQTPLIAVRL